MSLQGRVIAVNTSERKGVRKTSVGNVCLVPDFGLEGDAHGGKWHRQVSLLAMESIEKMIAQGLRVGPGDFAENITTLGLDLLKLPLGTKLKIGKNSLLEITQQGKVCHTRCSIYYQAGDCVMPKEGIFARVLKGGNVRAGDEIYVLSGNSDDQ